MNAFNSAWDTEFFMIGQSVMTVRSDRRTSPPSEFELIEDELRRLSAAKGRRRRSGRQKPAA